ncbi:hypothetical protein PM082_009655 [Marasmius tenuissimus]|nr:hypothetical protein PM082_009655 [Marasmius tenuissimus]
MNVTSDRVDVAMAEDELPEIEAKLNKVKEDLSSKRHLLGMDDEQHVRHLSQSPYLEAWLKAAAYKQRLLEKLRARKFERDRLERSHCISHGESRLHNQIEEGVKKREPSIQKLAKQYNKTVQYMTTLKKHRRCPANAIPPPEIQISDLFKLDVDDVIWQNIGLGDDDDVVPPPMDGR